MSILLDLCSALCLFAGSIVILTGSVGLLRFPDLFTRLHAVGVIDTLGCMLIVLGLLLQAGFSIAAFKLIIITVFILFTSPVATHALAKAALHGNVRPVLKDKAT